MTTIACNRTCMACDSLTDHGTTRLRSNSKISRIRNELIGSSGLTDGNILFLEWYRGDRKTRSKIELDICMLVLNQRGIFLYHQNLVPSQVKHPFYAVGSGAEVALGAMHAGASPKEAVEIACKVNINTGPPVRVYKL